MSKRIMFVIALSSFFYAAVCQEDLEVDGVIILQDSDDLAPEAGTIRWNGKDFEGYNGLRWVSLTNYAVVGTVSDRDGNIYQTTRIGNQEWMIENLRVTEYNDGVSIRQISEDSIWSAAESGAWCYYENAELNNDSYGKLYNWYAVNSGKLCPIDWHVPSDVEWSQLTDYLGGATKAGGKMKENSLDYWQPPNFKASNESGFRGLPGGYRISGFSFLGIEGCWWSDTEWNSLAWFRCLNRSSESCGRWRALKRVGFSVRCVKD